MESDDVIVGDSCFSVCAWIADDLVGGGVSWTIDWVSSSRLVAWAQDGVDGSTGKFAHDICQRRVACIRIYQNDGFRI